MRAIALALIVTGCGLDPFGEGGTVPVNLPTQGAGPYGRLASDDATPTDEPFVQDDRTAELYDPCALLGGPGLRLWYTREPVGDPADDQQIFHIDLPSAHDLVVAGPELALAAELGWEEGRVAAPAVADLGGGHLVMFYEGGVATRAVGRADSLDGGATWTRQPAPVLADATAPTAAVVDDRLEVYATRPSAPGIWRATGGLTAGALTFDAAPVVVARPDLPEAFDAYAVSDPAIVVERQPTGRLHWGLFFVGTVAADPDTAQPSVGYAGSFDGVAWERFGGADAQLAAPATGPTVVLPPASGLMIYSEVKRGRRALAAASNP